MGYNCGILYFSGNRQIRINHLHSYFTLRVSETLPFKGGLVALPSPFCQDELLLHTQKESVSRCDISRDRDVNKQKERRSEDPDFSHPRCSKRVIVQTKRTKFIVHQRHQVQENPSSPKTLSKLPFTMKTVIPSAQPPKKSSDSGNRPPKPTPPNLMPFKLLVPSGRGSC